MRELKHRKKPAKRNGFYTAKERGKGACLRSVGQWKHSNVSLRDWATPPCDSLGWSSCRAETPHFSPLGASHIIQQVELASFVLQAGVEGRGILQICLFGSVPVKYFYLGTGDCGHFPGGLFPLRSSSERIFGGPLDSSLL